MSTPHTCEAVNALKDAAIAEGVAREIFDNATIDVEEAERALRIAKADYMKAQLVTEGIRQQLFSVVPCNLPEPTKTFDLAN